MSVLRNKIIGNLTLIGFDLTQTSFFFRGIVSFLKDKRELVKQKGTNMDFQVGPNRPIFEDRYEESGTASGHYFHQDLLVARRIYENKPVRHVDIGSRTDGFISHVAVFREIEMFDIRDQKSHVKNIIFRKADLMQLAENMYDYCDSISALHSVEHFGLGRYGDPIDYFGHLKAINNIAKILKKGGVFYFSVPIGAQRINFNAHRVFSIKYLLEMLSDLFEIRTFSYVNDEGNLFENVKLESKDVENNLGCYYGCGIFELTKK